MQLMTTRRAVTTDAISDRAGARACASTASQTGEVQQP